MKIGLFIMSNAKGAHGAGIHTLGKWVAFFWLLSFFFEMESFIYLRQLHQDDTIM